MNALRQRAPWLGSRHRDTTCQTRTLAAPEADATAPDVGVRPIAHGFRAAS
jgi:hypothetical protein